MDGCGVYGLTKANQWVRVEDLVMFGTASSNSEAMIDRRLKVCMCVSILDSSLLRLSYRDILS